MPPRAELGNYLRPGNGDAIIRWLQSDQTRDVDAVVASSDMLAYGGLVASRVPGVPAGEAYVRLRALAWLKSERADPYVGRVRDDHAARADRFAADRCDERLLRDRFDGR